MEVTGKITKVLEKQSGVSKADKEWTKLSFILETNEAYNNLYCFEVFGTEKVEQFEKYNKVGQEVKVDFNVSTNEWNGKYFTSLQAWRIFKTEQSAEAEQSVEVEDSEDDLPF